ncbi:MAG: hypothetical protein IJ856_06910 [Candidatus Methanomethylophilaceae archaeon]|nr:hypothetical protein [Candidatus Methanomethylophilaceae archaeon]
MEVQDYIALVLVYLIIAVSLALSMYLEKKGYDGNITRKAVHIGVGNFVFVWWMFTESWIMLVFFTIPFAILLFVAMFKGNPISKSKIGDISNNRGHRTGLFLYAVSIMIMVLFFFDHWVAASVGIVAMTYGDAFGSIIGKRYGRHKTINGKSAEGSLGVFAFTAILGAVVILFYGFLITNGYYDGTYEGLLPFWGLAAVAGAITAVAEMLSPGEWDNIIIPTLVALSLVALGL